MLDTSWNYILDIAYGGVNHSLPGNGGPECVEFLSLRQRILETISYVAFAILLFLKTLPHCKIPQTFPAHKPGSGLAKRVLLILMCITFGIEVGFKVVTKQLIYLLNPCHVLSALQACKSSRFSYIAKVLEAYKKIFLSLSHIYLLIAPPSKVVYSVFRIQIYIIFGALLAVIFPVVNTRTLPCEVEVYWIQHLLILIAVPFFLISCEGPYVLEDFWDFSWATLTYSLYAFYMFLILQPLGMLSQVNLNSTVCPAVSDPFSGPYYRMIACLYIPALIYLVGKGVCLAGNLMLKILSKFEKVD